MNEENIGIRLLKKGRKGFFSTIFSRFGIILLLFIIQLIVLFGIFELFEEFLPHIYGLAITFIVFMVLYIFVSDMDPTVKNTWLITILLLPVFGSLLFIFTNYDIGHRALKKRVAVLIKASRNVISQSPEVSEKLKNENNNIYNLSKYLQRSGTFPTYNNSDVSYYKIGEEMFEQILTEIKKAKHFIFMEYFIIDEGLMWGKILEILAKKVKEGVEVRVMYDGSCEFNTLPCDYPERMAKLGIKCKKFAPLRPFVSTHYNYRDHRKILSIDGEVAFTGGINLADEYINKFEKHGHWKDGGIMVRGEAVKSFTTMFLQIWQMDDKKFDFYSYLPEVTYKKENGYVTPFGDCPLDKDKVGERVYIDILNRAKKYVHIMTPYLILDNNMESALRFAAEKGVDVKIILPGVPDKNLPFAIALTHYKSLIESGVKIYEYTPGFVHSKVFVSDDIEAVVGTINLDYRSLYHHFECGCHMYKSDCIKDIEKDFNETLDKCKMFGISDIKKEKFKRRLLGILLKPIAPLL